MVLAKVGEQSIEDFSVEDTTDYYRFINYWGKWYENYYREGRGILEDTDKKESFYIDKY